MLEIALLQVLRDGQQGQRQSELRMDWLMDTMHNRRLLVQQRDQRNQAQGAGAFRIVEQPLGTAPHRR